VVQGEIVGPKTESDLTWTWGIRRKRKEKNFYGVYYILDGVVVDSSTLERRKKRGKKHCLC
jgi:hypothetical protein